MIQRLAFTYIELLAVMVLSVFLVGAAMLFTIPSVEAYLMITDGTTLVDQGRYALRRVLREFQRNSSEDLTVQNGGTRLVVANEGVYQLVGNEAPYSLVYVSDGQTDLLAEGVALFSITRKDVPSRIFNGELVEGFFYYELSIGFSNHNGSFNKVLTLNVASR